MLHTRNDIIKIINELLLNDSFLFGKYYNFSSLIDVYTHYPQVVIYLSARTFIGNDKLCIKRIKYLGSDEFQIRLAANMLITEMLNSMSQFISQNLFENKRICYEL